MNRIRTITAGAVVAVVAAGGAVASGAVSSTSPPPIKPLAQAIQDAIAAPPVRGITARITFTNKVIDSSSLTGGGPLLTGASGRIWIADDGRARLELQSDRGDAQITTDGKTVTAYDASSNTAYEATLPQETRADASGSSKDGDFTTKLGQPESTDKGDPINGVRSTTPDVPSVDKISEVLAKLEQGAGLSAADPTTVAGQPAYSLKLTPKNGGLVGQAEIAWDAATGVPLRFGLYAKGASKPVLELAATDISYGAVDDAALSVPVPSGAKVERIDLGSSADHKPLTKAQIDALKAEHARRDAMSPADVAGALPFTLSAPDTLAGQPRSFVRLVGGKDADGTSHTGALVTYGQGLGGLAVLETPVDASKAAGAAPTAPAPSSGGHHGMGGDQTQLSTPSVDINGSKAFVLPTALGTVVRWQAGGVQYTVVGSVTSDVAEAAARGL